ncbi:hypothetical protein P8605_48225, partial [Streptomyces sp. T-3]|nr:hypothetical protein [Streptomyces sp. T-3]
MRRTNLTGPDGSWTGLLLEVAGRPRPALCLYAADGGRLLLDQQGAPLLLAEVQPYLYGVDFWRADTYRPPVPPLRADRARAYAAAGDRSTRWAHHFAAALAEGPGGPLHDGRWILTPRTPLLRQWNRYESSAAAHWGDLLVEGHPGGEIDWFVHSGSWEILPLRAMPGPDDARVKAYRKQARDGSLPPVLLWWVSGLDCHLLLDGHARLAAAIAADTEPELMVLHRAAPQDEVDAGTEAAATAYEADLAR